MFTVRTLPNEEYDRLKATPSGEWLNPDNSIVIVAESGGEIIGRMALINLIHLEATWIREDRRGGLILKRMEEALLDHARELGLKYVHTYATEEKVEALLERENWQRLPVSVWVREL